MFNTFKQLWLVSGRRRRRIGFTSSMEFILFRKYILITPAIAITKAESFTKWFFMWAIQMRCADVGVSSRAKHFSAARTMDFIHRIILSCFFPHKKEPAKPAMQPVAQWEWRNWTARGEKWRRLFIKTNRWILACVWRSATIPIVIGRIKTNKQINIAKPTQPHQPKPSLVKWKSSASVAAL